MKAHGIFQQEADGSGAWHHVTTPGIKPLRQLRAEPHRRRGG